MVNRLSLVIMIISIIVITLDFVFYIMGWDTYGLEQFRMVLLLLMTLAILYLNVQHYHTAAKLLLIFGTIFLLYLVPPIFGFSKAEFIIWFPYSAIAISIVPHFIFSPSKQTFLWAAVIFICFNVVFFMEPIQFMGYLGSKDDLSLIVDNFFFVKVAQVSMFFFGHVAIGYLIKANRTYQLGLMKANDTMREDADIIQQQKEELENQNEELKQIQEELTLINESLENRVKQRTFDLQKSNETLSEYAFINAHLLRAPLCRIQGLVNLLFMENHSTSAVELLNHMDRASDELEKVINTINEVLDNGEQLTREHLYKIYQRDTIQNGDSDS